MQFLSSTDSFVRFPPIAEFWQEKYGFIGDDGYIKLQAALTEHMHDREVPTSFEPQWAVFKLSIRSQCYGGSLALLADKRLNA